MRNSTSPKNKFKKMNALYKEMFSLPNKTDKFINISKHELTKHEKELLWDPAAISTVSIIVRLKKMKFRRYVKALKTSRTNN